jgi:hypothetical protein
MKIAISAGSQGQARIAMNTGQTLNAGNAISPYKSNNCLAAFAVVQRVHDGYAT